MHWRKQEPVSQGKKDTRRTFRDESEVGRNNKKMLTIHQTESQLNCQSSKTSRLFNGLLIKGTFLSIQERRYIESSIAALME